MKHNRFRILAGLIILTLTAGFIPGNVMAADENSNASSQGTESRAAEDTAPVPMVLISGDDITDPLNGGETRAFTVYFRNLSDRTLESPVVSFTPSDALFIPGGASSFALSDIPAKGTGSIVINIQAAQTITAAGQSVSAELRFNYNNNVSDVQGSASDKISIPAAVTTPAVQPVVLVTRSDSGTPVTQGEVRDVTLNFLNTGDTGISSPVVSVSASDALTILNDNSSFLLPDLGPGDSADIVIRIQAAKEISSASQYLSTDLKFNYSSGGTVTQGTSSDKVGIPADVTAQVTPAAQMDSPVPNIIISSYTFGDAQVTAGSKFKLDVTFKNTGKLKIENIVAAVDGGESFAIDGTTNSFFYSSIDAGSDVTQEIPMQALSTAKTGAQTISFSFKYEYTDAQKRSQASADIKISVPIYQPDRFQINAPSLPETVTAGEETALTLVYVNKGKSDVANVEADIEGSDIETPAATQYIGNVAAGASGNIGFSLTPDKAGDLKVILKVSYEGVDQQTVTREFPITLHVEEPVPATDSMTDVEVPQSSFPWGFVIAGGICAAAAVTVLIIRRKKKKAKKDEEWEEWDEPEDTK